MGAHEGREGRTAVEDAPAPTTGLSTLDALPVALDLGEAHAAAVRRWVEGVLGWQVVDDRTGALVPPALRLVDAQTTGAGAAGALPSLLLVAADDAPGRTADLTVSLRPDAVLRWPEDRTRLAATAADALARRAPAVRGAATVSVGGLAGGVGTTTVALALAGLDGWAGHATLVAYRGHGPAAPIVDTAALAAVDLWARAAPLPGTDGCRAVRLADGPGVRDRVPPTADPQVERCVVDLGVDPDADIVVCRPDGATLASAADVVASIVVVVGGGVIPLPRLRRALPGRRLVHLPTSSRVARAGVRGRVPAGLPGTFLQQLLAVHRLVRS